MAKYGETFLTRSLLETRDLEWVEHSPMQFCEGEYRNGIQYFTLSLLGVINGLPGSRWFRLACTVVTCDNGCEGTSWCSDCPRNRDEILGWKVIRWRS